LFIDPQVLKADYARQVTSGEGLNAYGAATWGQFFIYQGFNAHAGWMHTSSGVDNVDEFAEAIVTGADGALSYRYGNELRRVTSKTITLSYRGADGSLAKRDFVTFATHHGPIVREEGGKWIAFALMNRPVMIARLTWVLGLTLYAAVAVADPAYLLKPARVFDGVDPKPHEGWSVLVRGDRIVAAGPAIAASPDATVVDLSGDTLMPGLIEGHSHLFLHSYNETPWDDQVPELQASPCAWEGMSACLPTARTRVR
jgi:Penicillin amidase